MIGKYAALPVLEMKQPKRLLQISPLVGLVGIHAHGHRLLFPPRIQHFLQDSKGKVGCASAKCKVIMKEQENATREVGRRSPGHRRAYSPREKCEEKRKKGGISDAGTV
jgi:hypothetical protein